MTTPSLRMLGVSNGLSKTTLRPRGPIVTLTAFDSMSTPFLMEYLALALNLSFFVMDRTPPDVSLLSIKEPGCRVRVICRCPGREWHRGQRREDRWQYAISPCP